MSIKVAQPPAVPMPERKPEPPPANPAGGGAFGAVLADVSVPTPARRPDPPLQLAGGQDLPPRPGRRPDPPVQVANGQDLPPLPGRRPDVPLQVANGQDIPPPPGQKPEAPARLASATGAKEANAERIIVASQQVARLSGHSFAAILAQATQESNLDPKARSRTSSAAGAFQFLERTWLDLVRRHGAAYGLGDMARAIESRGGIPVVKDPALRKQILDLRHDVDLAAGMAARYLAEGREKLARSLKRPVTETESRIAYVLGVGGAASLLRAADRNPTASGADLLPSAAKANHSLFYARDGRELSAKEVVARLSHKMENDQKDMFTAIARAAEQPIKLHGQPSPLGAFQAVSLPADAGSAGGTAG